MENKCYLKVLFIWFGILLSVNLYAKSSKQIPSVNETLKKINTVACNQYSVDGSQIFFKICPSKYKEIDINYNSENSYLIISLSPLKKVKFFTKYALINFFKENNLNDYLRLSKKEMAQLLNSTDIDNEIVTKYNNYLHENIKYLFITLKNLPFNYTLDEVKNICNTFGAIITNDRTFTLKNFDKNNKIYIPKYKWIYDRVNRAYYKMLNENEYCKVTVKPVTVIQVLFKHSRMHGYIFKEVEDLINKYQTKIRTVIENEKNIKIIFNTQLSKEDIENNIFDILKSDDEIIVSGGA